MKTNKLPFIVNGPPCRCGHARIRHIGQGRSGIEMFDGPCQDCDCLPAGYMPDESIDYVAMRRNEHAIEVALTRKRNWWSRLRRNLSPASPSNRTPSAPPPPST